MITEEKRNWAIEQLQKRAEELGYPPKKADFDEVTRFQIKGALGPWPRALEAAGLKESKDKKPRIKAKNRSSESKQAAEVQNSDCLH